MRFQIMMADAEHFFQGGYARNCFRDTVFEQGAHTEETGLSADGLGRFAIESHLANDTVHAKHLKDALAASVAGVMTVGATSSAAEVGALRLGGGQTSCLDFRARRRVRFLAFGADHA